MAWQQSAFHKAFDDNGPNFNLNLIDEGNYNEFRDNNNNYSSTTMDFPQQSYDKFNLGNLKIVTIRIYFGLQLRFLG